MKSGESGSSPAGHRVLEEIRPTARRPLDLLLGVVGVLAVVGVLLIVRVASGETEPGAPEELRALLPESLLVLVAGVANITVMVLIGVTAVERLLRGEFRQITRALVAGAAAYALTGAVNAAVVAVSGPGGPPAVLAASEAHSVFTNPLHAYLAAAVAYLGGPLGHLARVRAAMWAGVALTSAAAVLAGVTTPLSLLLTVVVGWTCASLAGYAVGLARPVPATDRLVRELRRFGLDPLSLTPDGTDSEGNQRFAVLTVDRRLDVVLMRADDTRGLWKRLLGVLLLRDPVAPPILLGLHRRLEHAALMAFAARSAGAAAPRVVAIGELGLGTVALVLEHVRLTLLDDTADDDLTDAALDGVWAELALLHRHRIVHGNLNGDTVGWRLCGRVAFAGLSGGGVAAVALKASLDQASLLAVLALRVGERRAVDSAVRVLGVETVAGVLPFLQKAGMPFGLRRRLRAHDGDVLGGLRSRITEIAPEAPARPARLERMRPRTVVSVVAATAVGVALAYQLTGVDFSTIAEADLGWASAAFAASLVCMLAAALALMGFVPIRLDLGKTILVQYAGSYIRIAAPAGLGSLAINTRFVTRMGASPGVAISAVGLSQVVGLITHLPLLLVCAYLTGTAYLADFSPSNTFVAVTALLSVAIAVVVLHPRLRHAVTDRVRPYFQGTVPQMLDLLQHPRRLAMGVGGTLLLTAGFVMCLYFCIEAFGGSAGLAAVAVVFLAGNAIGSAAPTPGGIGAVEAALLGGLTAVAGVPAAVGLPAVLLYRLFTFWLPVLPGWGAFHLLQRWKAI
ncbi:lysylphosphatidylglycerol synthase transmembrane domain-containing protein [Nocardiopsis trehalosi]|uniref:lysylphosphatidylglycerol synthase transmembrane domain-containing protein n=1 Tax=Nocardiopsis trehalosi TaxID=109329 RepID=UPI0034E2DDD4